MYIKVDLSANQNGIVNLSTQKEKWQRWWPAGENDFVYDSFNFPFQQQLLKTAVLRVPFRDTLLPAMVMSFLGMTLTSIRTVNGRRRTG